jgi:peptidoglycan/xylan/chitin deacetylase (PgdA/CDA1 family)
VARRLACINIDLDALPHYAAIHGLEDSALPRAGVDLVDRVATARFLELCDGAGVKGTLFAVGRDVGDAGARLLRGAVDAGHEVGNHTFAHDYTLARQAPADIAADISRCADTLEALTGTRPRGFRAPSTNALAR